ncbi:MAG: Anaerobic nitric oxide reductase transcription regulator NorR [Gammaproteobacteria bacterium]|nr:Anaerobic nitric oxide reductase transcription regulator NorR [Gammaproteobacteria bacterium]
MDERETGTEHLLRALAEDTAGVTEDDYLRALMRTAARVLGVRFAFMGELNEAFPVGAKFVDFWDGEKFAGPGDFQFVGTPCEDVFRTGELRCYPRGVAGRFPDAPILAELGVESFLAVPVKDKDGAVIGHFAIMDDKPMEGDARAVSVLRLFAGRAGAELERRRYKDALHASRQRMASVLASAMDAIVAVAPDRRIRVFNSAAERIFACSADWATGMPLDRLIAAPFRAAVAERLGATAANETGRQSIGAAEGFRAVRANHEEFPFEATISRSDGAGEPLYIVILRDVNERQRTQAELERLQSQNGMLIEEMLRQSRLEGVIGQSPAMQDVLQAVATVAAADATVIVHGETGTGKEMVAHAIHHLSERRERQLVKMNCAALPADLVESELFGHEKGAFTGAVNERKGRFELANGGTLFLDEVGELTLPAQAKLLRVLQEREFERVGGSRTIRVDVRVIAATNRDLAEMVQQGTFRSDLYYRLNVFPITLPPLRARTGDIPLLAQHFLERFARKLGRKLTTIEPDSLQRLLRYDWPGNVRELQNVMERAALLSAGPEVLVRDPLRAGTVSAGGGEVRPRPLEEVEAEHIRRVLQSTDWKIEGKRGAAAVLRLEPSTLRYRMQKLGIRRPPPPDVASPAMRER